MWCNVNKILTTSGDVELYFYVEKLDLDNLLKLKEFPFIKTFIFNFRTIQSLISEMFS